MNSYNDKEEKIIEMIESLIRNGVDDELIISRFESKIFDLKKPELYFWFAKNVKGIDIESHEQVVIDKRDPEWNYKFAKNVKGADVKAHGKAIINSCNPEWNYKFARDIIGADVKAHEQVVFKYGNQIESELESLDNYLDDAIASSEKDASKSMTK